MEIADSGTYEHDNAMEQLTPDSLIFPVKVRGPEASVQSYYLKLEREKVSQITGKALLTASYRISLQTVSESHSSEMQSPPLHHCGYAHIDITIPTGAFSVHPNSKAIQMTPETRETFPWVHDFLKHCIAKVKSVYIAHKHQPNSPEELVELGFKNYFDHGDTRVYRADYLADQQLPKGPADTSNPMRTAADALKSTRMHDRSFKEELKLVFGEWLQWLEASTETSPYLSVPNPTKRLESVYIAPIEEQGKKRLESYKTSPNVNLRHPNRGELGHYIAWLCENASKEQHFTLEVTPAAFKITRQKTTGFSGLPTRKNRDNILLALAATFTVEDFTKAFKAWTGVREARDLLEQRSARYEQSLKQTFAKSATNIATFTNQTVADVFCTLCYHTSSLSDALTLAEGLLMPIDTGTVASHLDLISNTVQAFWGGQRGTGILANTISINGIHRPVASLERRGVLAPEYLQSLQFLFPKLAPCLYHGGCPVSAGKRDVQSIETQHAQLFLTQIKKHLTWLQKAENLSIPE